MHNINESFKSIESFLEYVRSMVGYRERMVKRITSGEYYSFSQADFLEYGLVLRNYRDMMDMVSTDEDMELAILCDEGMAKIRELDGLILSYGEYKEPKEEVKMLTDEELEELLKQA